MTPERWQLVKSVLADALAIELGSRAVFLANACVGDAELKAEVESLLAEQEHAHSFIEQPAFNQEHSFLGDETLPLIASNNASTAAAHHQQIGPYKILRELAHGGMGAVYLAERDDAEYRQQVAIKLIKSGMDSAFVLQRFRAERQILATLNHPNIARLLDGGTTADGAPYLVMEYVEGQPLDQYCDNQNLSTLARLKLFRQVCAAVQYAHQRLIIHRDLKPGNMLVTADGVVKLLDFGIAKLLTGESSGQTMDATATGVRLMTPAYASPEQIKEEPITTASDVYSLGVVLYELLTGHRPYHLKSMQPQELLRAVCETEPERPSAAITRIEAGRSTDSQTPITLTPEFVSKTRDGQPDKLRRRLQGDIDNIVLMAMRKEPERRYASVEQFSEDLRRHLEGLPVIARKDTLAYRSGKFMQRNTLALSAAALILVTLMTGIVMTTRARARAERRFNDVRKLAKAVVFDYSDAIDKLPGSTPVRQRIVSDALEYLDSLSREAGNDRALKLELAEAYQRIGNIQGNGYYSNLGDTEGALTSYRKALALQESLAADEPKNLDVRRHLARTYTLMGDVLWDMGKLNETLESYNRALLFREAAVAENPVNVEDKRELAKLLLSLGDLNGSDGLPNLGHTDTAAAYYKKSFVMSEALAAAQPQNTDLQSDVFEGLLRIGDIQRITGKPEEAARTYHQALVMIEALFAADPHNLYQRTKVGATAQRLGMLLNDNERAAEGLAAIKRALAVMEPLIASESANASFKRNLSVAHNHVVISLLKLNRPAEALAHARQSMTIIETLAAADGSNNAFRSDTAITHRRMGDAFAQLNNVPAALREHRQALGLQEEMSAESPDAFLRENVGISQWRVAGLLARTGDASGALNYYQKSLANYDALFGSGAQLTITSLDYAATLAKAAAVYAKLNRWQEARAAYQRSLDVYVELRGKGVLPAREAGKSDELAREIVKCEVRLAKLR